MEFSKEKLRKRNRGISCQDNPSVIGKASTAGITLVALVVTSVVLLILAGITLTFVLGDNSVFSRASQAKIQTEIAKIEERAQMIYSSKLMETASGTLNTKVETSQIISQLTEEGYTIEDRPVSAGDITGISLNKTSLTMGKNSTAEITVTYEGVEELFIYYAEVQGKYYQMHSNKGCITIDRGASNLTKADFEAEGGTGGEETPSRDLTITSNPTGIVTAGLKKESTSIIEVTSSETEGDTTITVTCGSYEKTCTVKVIKPVLATEITLNETSYTVTGGKSWTNNLQLIATLKPDNVTEKEVKWESSNPEIATVEMFSEIKTSKTAYTDSEGNTAQIPVGFAVGTSENVNKVPGGLVIQDNKGNQFVWIPIGNMKKDGTTTTITLGRYEFNATNGTPTLKQDADNYTQPVSINRDGGSKPYFQELLNDSRNTAAKDLGDFVNKTKANGGYYLARYEASGGSGNTTGSVKSQYNQPVWNDIKQPTAATNCQNMYQGNSYVESDLVNSYAWDTAIVFIQKYISQFKFKKYRKSRR